MNDNKDCRKRQSTLTDFLPSNNGHRRLTTLDRSKRQLFVAKNRRRSTADWQEATAVEQDDDSSSNNNNNNQNNNNDTVNECNDIPFTSSWSEGDIDHLSDSEEEAEEGYDLTQEDLSRFTAMYSQCPILDEDAEVATTRRDDESDSEECEALDLTQEECQQFFEEQSHGPTDYVAEPPAKKLKWTTEKKTELSRISQYMKQHETSSTPPVFHDSDTKVYVESPGGELRIFKVGESFILENDSLDLPKAIYNIVELKYSQTTVKKANCKVFMLLRETFVGSKSIKDTPELFSQYVVFRHTKWIALRKLRKQVDAPRCQFMIDPPSKESKGIGWQLSYRLVRATKPCVLEKEPTCLDLFAGVGGMSMGFHNAGFAVRWCVEKDPLTASVLANNQQRLLNKKLKEEMYQLRKHRDSARTQRRVQRDGQKMRCAEAEEEDDGDCRVFDEDVHIFLKKVKRNDSAYPVKGDVNHVHASPPCQGFSKANRTRGMGKNDRSNNELCFAFTRAIRLLQPETASFENVTGMLDLSCVQYLQRIVADLLQLRYQLQLKIMDSSHHGDAQARARVIIVATRHDVRLPDLPEPTHGCGDSDGQKPIVTVLDALHDLAGCEPTPGTGLVTLGPDDKPNLVSKHTRNETVYAERFKLKASKPSCTIRCGNQIDHYDVDRSLTIREFARLQSFPDDFVFFGSQRQMRTQIGNAVPVGLASAIAKEIMHGSYIDTSGFFDDYSPALLEQGQ